MTWALDEFRRAFKDEVGEVQQLARDSAIDRWVNEGQGRLRVYRQRDTPLSWAAGATSVTLPTDFHHEERVAPDYGVTLSPYDVWNGVLRFRHPLDVRAGTGVLFYWGNWPYITGSADSQLPELGDQACLSFALFRFFKRLASSRADYRRYAAIAQGNGVGVDDLATLAEQHYNDFTEARDALEDVAAGAARFFED